LREYLFRVARLTERLLPPGALAALLWPIAFLRAAADMILRPGRNPPPSLPPPPGHGRSSRRLAGVRARTDARLGTASLIWSDRFTQPRWRDRFEMGELESLREIVAQRPAIIVSLHFGGVFMLPALLRAHRIPTASVVGRGLWPIAWGRMRRAALTRIDDLPLFLESGDARAMVRFLQPGRCLMIGADYPLGDQAAATWDGAGFRLSTSPFRLARLAGAAVVPVIVRAGGTWRYAIHVGSPVPDALIRAQDHGAAVAHVATELLPVAAAAPEQALPYLVAAFATPGAA
jgi:lauroyl/myristoyl acyltransferase